MRAEYTPISFRGSFVIVPMTYTPEHPEYEGHHTAWWATPASMEENMKINTLFTRQGE